MAKITSLEEVGIYTADQEASKAFYTEKVGLTVRSSMPEFGYLALGTSPKGEDASLAIWQPTSDWEEDYEEAKASIGIVTGLGFRTGDLEQTVEALTAAGVKTAKDSDVFARFWDPDGNVLFLQQDPEGASGRPGVMSLDWITVVTHDEAKAGEFFRTLGLQSMTVPGEEEGAPEYTVYRVGAAGTAILPFTPVKEMYDDPSDYDSDLAHLGENTSIMFQTDDAYAFQEELLSKGIRFRTKAEERPWGGIAMRIYDPDENHYMIYQMKG